ncbi:uncharacterized protein LOC110028823 isoform X2 [Phalaenopsis equestris]|uniref:uncharacterized protein LOC110028823 isoform X2 n=1 Tax=Phalaenopsis equestris TaxID=78828 RepID=UPI0009E23836|nr:uncharacterized protein LOC110028823 isoform X2 [Phalaenopsis equestris]
MVWGWGERVFSSAGASIGEGFAGVGRGVWFWQIGGIGSDNRRHVGAAIGVTAMLGLALAATIVLSSHSFELNSLEDERNAMRKQKRKEYKKLRKKCQYLLKLVYEADKMLEDIDEVDHRDSPSFCECHVSSQPEDVECAGYSFSHQHPSPDNGNVEHTLNDEASTFRNGSSTILMKNSLGAIENSQAAAASDDKSDLTCADAIEERGTTSITHAQESMEAISPYSKTSSLKSNASKSTQTVEDFTTWQRIIRLDAVRANAEWVIHSPAQAAVTEEKALELAEFVGLKDYDHLEPCMIYHAARLVAVLEAYAIYDPVIGYCQGMSDLLSPIIAIMEEDDEAFWCFVGFMMKARHNFRLDEVGIRRQLSIVSKIIKFKDPHLYKHLEKLQAEDCFFVYRMVVVLFRRELDFEQTLCLWEVMWADQAAIRSGFGKSAWARIRSHAPPTDDLLLYAIAACVLQRRKLIIERYSSMEEILRECNNMAGNLDVWKLLDDAHDLVVTLHEKIS